MKKTFTIEDLDCPNCAAKLECALKGIDGVENASVNFIAQKVTVEAAEDAFDAIMKAAVKEAKKFDAVISL